MNKIIRTRLKAEIVEEILNNYSYNVDCWHDRINSHYEKLKTCEENEKRYYESEIKELLEKIKAYEEIVSHLEKLF